MRTSFFYRLPLPCCRSLLIGHSGRVEATDHEAFFMPAYSLAFVLLGIHPIRGKRSESLGSGAPAPGAWQNARSFRLRDNPAKKDNSCFPGRFHMALRGASTRRQKNRVPIIPYWDCLES
jgi:hypothetical protein